MLAESITLANALKALGGLGGIGGLGFVGWNLIVLNRDIKELKSAEPKSRLAVIEFRLNDVDKKLDKMDTKLDRILDRMSER